MATTTTLCYMIKDDKILLQQKSKGLFGECKWNGPGGKAKEDETPEECAKREVMEETGVNALDVEKQGVLTFYNGDELFTTTHVFMIKDFKGNPDESREGIVRWFSFDEIPFEKMWPDDKFWMPLLLDGKKFEGTFYFDEELKQLLRHELKVI